MNNKKPVNLSPDYPATTILQKVKNALLFVVGFPFCLALGIAMKFSDNSKD